MILPEGLLIALFAAISLLSAAAAVTLTGYIQNALSKRHVSHTAEVARGGHGNEALSPVTGPIRYAFSDGQLLSDVREDDPFLAPDTDRNFAPVALSEAMATLHPDLPDHIGDLIVKGQQFCVIGYLGSDALSVLGLVEKDQLVVAVSPTTEGQGRLLEHSERRIKGLRQALELSASAQWTEAADGRVTWCNEAYLELCREYGQRPLDQLHWPLPRVFGRQLDPAPTEGKKRRCHLSHPDGASKLWFETAARPRADGETLFSAHAIDRLVTAETSLRDFVQTLSKTFATLPVGLVVFDRKRELVLFNPALVSVSMLEPGFLTRRPTLRAFLDQLREMQRMPEPRDYRSWREEIAVLEQGAEQDRYHEIWTLLSGETLRVTGRPHPNGAIAFVFEDISQEVSLTRKFRTDLDLDRCILDDLPAGLIVFNRDGDVLRTNEPYRAMVDGQSNGGANGITTIDAPDGTLNGMTRIWQQMFMPSGLWGEIRQFTHHEIERAAWSDTVIERQGTPVHCRIAPLKGGNTIVWFVPTNPGLGEFLSDSAWLNAFDTDAPNPPADHVQTVSEHGEGAA